MCSILIAINDQSNKALKYDRMTPSAELTYFQYNT